MPFITTCVDMATAALRTAGITGTGQTPLAEDINTAFQLLMECVETWKRERFMAWRATELIVPSTGAQSYAMPDRPPRLDSAYARLRSGAAGNAGPLDYPLTIIDSQDDYNLIGLKGLTTFPSAIWYQADFPTGTLFPYPVLPADQFELHVFYTAGLPTYHELTDPLGLPPEYIRALRYELAIMICMDYDKQVNKSHVGALMGAKANIKAVNARMGNMQMPAGLVPGGAGSGGISGAVGPHQSVIVLDSGLPVLG